MNQELVKEGVDLTQEFKLLYNLEKGARGQGGTVGTGERKWLVRGGKEGKAGAV